MKHGFLSRGLAATNRGTADFANDADGFNVKARGEERRLHITRGQREANGALQFARRRPFLTVSASRANFSAVASFGGAVAELLVHVAVAGVAAIDECAAERR